MENLICHFIILDAIILIVSIFNFLFIFLGLNGTPMIPQNQKNKDSVDNVQESQNKNNQEEKKMMQTFFVPTPVFFNPMLNQKKCFYGKYPKKKARPFTERAGDWICNNCKNLNFAFRNECNRCKIVKKDCIEILKNNEETKNENINITKENQFYNTRKTFKNKKNYTNQFNDRETKNKEIELNDNNALNEESFEG
jgi:hypothetical protein